MTRPKQSSPTPSSGWLGGTGRLGSPNEPNFNWLLAALVMLITGHALMPDDFLANVVLSVGVAIVGLATMPLLPRRGSLRFGQLALCAGAILFVWVGPRIENLLVAALTRISLVGFFVSVAWLTIWHLVRARRVTPETLVGAISGYLLLGIAFTMLFSMVEILNPGALRLGIPADASLASKSSDLMYFSFITLTTVGYGDMTPASDGARLLAMAEGITGQFYVAAVVARLISLLVSSRREGPVQ
ncbi:MAG: ion channel [Gemmatimonadota bacterium]|nr:ion channel [Gemmatimonadota bacterium]MDH5197849.1 ion channel [Gemmatimonadota bacterium]